MAKLSFMKFYPYDWINDTRSLSASAKGCWIDLLCLMWNAPKRGLWTGTFEEFSRVTGTPWEAAMSLIQELSSVSRVTKRDNGVTLENRRMVREEKAYKSHAIRQREYRERHKSDAKVTPKTLDVRLLKTLDKDNNTPYSPPKGDMVYVKPDREKQLPQFLVYAYKVAKGFQKNDREWDKANWSRFARPAKELAALFGSWKPAVDCIEALSRRFNDKGLDWTLSTIAKHAHEWKLKREKENGYASNGGTSIHNADAQRKRESDNPDDRGLIAGGKVLAGVRTLSSFIPEAEDVGGIPGGKDAEYPE